MSTEDSQTQPSTAILLQTLRERQTGLVATLHPSLSADLLQALQAKGKLLSQPLSPGEHAVAHSAMNGVRRGIGRGQKQFQRGVGDADT